MQFSKKVLAKRLENLQQKIVEQKLDGFLISSEKNRFYLSGWKGDSESGYFLITRRKAFVITDNRYTEEVAAEIPEFELREYGKDEKFWEKIFSDTSVKSLGFEAKHLSVFSLKQFKKKVKTKFVPTSDFVESLRAEKDSEEVEKIKRAADICNQAFGFVLKNIRSGQTEKQVAWEMEKLMREKGAEKNAWDPFIVASGPNSSKVHYAAGERSLKKRDQVLLDWGCYFEGYASDISRVIFLGTPNTKQIEVYEAVVSAQAKAAAELRVGGSTKKVDLVAREFLRQKSEFVFGHAVGHGVGLDVHELPHVNAKTKEKFKVNNVITIEPGIYEPGWGGVRIEDMFLVKPQGYEVLTNTKKDLSQIII